MPVDAADTRGEKPGEARGRAPRGTRCEVIQQHETATRAAHPQHFADDAQWIGDDVQNIRCVNGIEVRVGKRQATGVHLAERHVRNLTPAESCAGACEHRWGQVDGHDTTDGYHNLSHHGKSKEKLEQLKAIDRHHMALLADLFGKLKGFTEDGESLLDRTMVLYGSNLGNANTHVTTNLPVLLAGGGFRHGQHLAFSRERNYPLPNLFVSMLQRLGIEADRFASSTGTMRGLEPA